MRWQRGRSAGNTIDARGRRGGGGRVAIPSGLGLVGVIVFVAFQLLSGGSGYAVPTAFQLGAPGDFAWAYVIAHEVGHHVQHLRGTSDEVRRLQREDPEQANPLSVRLELQADCYAGVWAHSVFEQLEEGDVDEAIRASEAIGDDRLQRR